MMTSQKLALLLLTLTLMLLGCTSPDSTSPPTPAPGSTANSEFTDPGFNLLVAVEGEVLLKRSTWPDYHPTAFGAVLERGDLLKLSAGGQATVLCDSLTTWAVPAGAPAGLSSGCPQPPEAPLVWGGAQVGNTRGFDSLVPYIISPRMTDLLNSTPTLRWNDSGATSYNVQVRGGDLSWSQADVSQSELVYPGEPALKPGVSYVLVVVDSNGKSSQDEGTVGLGFRLLREDEAEQIRAYGNRLAGLGLSDEIEAFALAQLYAGQNLRAEAIEILAGLVEAGHQQAAVHQLLADLYAQIGLFLLAEPRYLEAIALAETQANLEAVAASQADLAEVYFRLGKTDEAIHRLTQAQTGYETLGDTDKANEIAERLEELQ
jgi:hypothetical protein